MERAYFQYFIEELEEKELLQATIMGHLVIEYMIERVLEVNGYSISKLERINFPKKIELAIQHNIIPHKQEDLYLGINNLRNNFAHELDYQPTFEDIYSLVVKAINGGIDFTDDIITDPVGAKKFCGSMMCLWEVLGNICLNLYMYLDSKGIQFPQ